MISKFIGRQKELQQFQNALDNLERHHSPVLFVYDAVENAEHKGGIGKTLLLYQFVDIAKSEKYRDYLIVVDQILDFYEPVIRDRLSRLSRYVKMLEDQTKTKAFDRFWKSAQDYYTKNVSLEKVIQEYYAGLTSMCRETTKKVVAFFDTFEVAEKTLNHILPPYRFVEDVELENSITILSGRNAPDFSAPLWTGRESQVLTFPLEGFSHDEAKTYFISAGYPELSKENVVAINKKAKRRPILLALISDYLNTIFNVQDILNLKEEDFKEQLVSFVNEFKDPPVGQAILAMAHLKHRCNSRFLRKFVEPVDDFDEVYQKLKALSFVRSLGGIEEDYVVLHDEMQKMVSDFVLDKVYRDGSLRREISEEAIKYYDEEIEELREKETESVRIGDVSNRQVTRDEMSILKAERGYHNLYCQRGENLDFYFYELYDPYLEEGQLDYCFVLQSHLDDLKKLLELPMRAQNRIELRAARLHTEKYQLTSNKYYYDEAKRRFDMLIQDAKKQNAESFIGVLLYDYGSLLFSSRELPKAETTVRESVDILDNVQLTDHDLLYFRGKAKNWLGYILYSEGKFKESIAVLKKAENHLIEADQMVQKAPKISDELRVLRRRQIDGWLAQVRGNLSRVFRETGESQQSLSYGRSSLYQRRKLGNPREIIRGLNTVGLILTRNGEISRAIRLYREAEQLLENVPDPILEGRISTNKATLLFKRDHFSDILTRHTRRSLMEAKQALGVEQTQTDEARDLLSTVVNNLIRSNARELATAYYNLGELELMEGKHDKAIKAFERSVEVSKNSQDSYTLLNALQRLVLTAYLMDDAKRFQEFVEQFMASQSELKEFEETARYVVRFYITLGNYYYDRLFNGKDAESFENDFRAAFRSYTDAILYAHRHAEGSVKLAEEILEERILDLLTEQKTVPESLKGELLTDWQKRGLETDFLQRYLND